MVRARWRMRAITLPYYPFNLSVEQCMKKCGDVFAMVARIGDMMQDVTTSFDNHVHTDICILLL